MLHLGKTNLSKQVCAQSDVLHVSWCLSFKITILFNCGLFLLDFYFVLGSLGKCYKVPAGLEESGKRKRKGPSKLQEFGSWYSKACKLLSGCYLKRNEWPLFGWLTSCLFLLQLRLRIASLRTDLLILVILLDLVLYKIHFSLSCCNLYIIFFSYWRS